VVLLQRMRKGEISKASYEESRERADKKIDDFFERKTEMNDVKLVWATPHGDDLIAYMARVSNPANQENPDSARLIAYLIRNQHWSPLEMVNAVVEINTTRDIGRQILRHRSFSFQEFSGRYATYDALEAAPLRECRLQDQQNRQNSLANDDADLEELWVSVQNEVRNRATKAYEWALGQGIAKEQARALLPEGLTPSRMYMNGTLRSWVHYLQLRSDAATQKEHREIAQQIAVVLREAFPATMKAALP